MRLSWPFTRHRGSRRLGLPAEVAGALFDLDGVLTNTAALHEEAWRQTFDDFLGDRSAQPPFSQEDYLDQVDGKPRLDGVRDFLASRRITLPEGSPADEPGSPTVWGLATRKNHLLLEMLRTEGAHVFEGSTRYLRACQAAGLRRAVVTSSANAHAVLRAAHLTPLVEVVVDGYVAERQHLRGKPAADYFLAAAQQLGLSPGECAVFEDAIAGVQAGRAGGFGAVVGVDRSGQEGEQLRDEGADIVVADLEQLLL